MVWYSCLFKNFPQFVAKTCHVAYDIPKDFKTNTTIDIKAERQTPSYERDVLFS